MSPPSKPHRSAAPPAGRSSPRPLALASPPRSASGPPPWRPASSAPALAGVLPGGADRVVRDAIEVVTPVEFTDRADRLDDRDGEADPVDTDGLADTGDAGVPSLPGEHGDRVSSTPLANRTASLRRRRSHGRRAGPRRDEPLRPSSRGQLPRQRSAGHPGVFDYTPGATAPPTVPAARSANLPPMAPRRRRPAVACLPHRPPHAVVPARDPSARPARSLSVATALCRRPCSSTTPAVAAAPAGCSAYARCARAVAVGVVGLTFRAADRAGRLALPGVDQPASGG